MMEKDFVESNVATEDPFFPTFMGDPKGAFTAFLLSANKSKCRRYMGNVRGEAKSRNEHQAHIT